MSKIPKFEKRHFEYMSEIFKEINKAGTLTMEDSISSNFLQNINKAYIEYFAEKLSKTNINFDKDKFKEACYVK